MWMYVTICLCVQVSHCIYLCISVHVHVYTWCVYMSYEKNKRGFFFVHEARLSSCSTARDAHLKKIHLFLAI